MKIVSLSVQNVKRIKAARIAPNGAMVQITGRNGQGKTSILDAIEMTLAGKSSACPKPVRMGTKKAVCVVDLGDIKVTRRWTSAGGSHLSIESVKDGPLTSPQSVLDRLIGRLSFDPLGFMRMKPVEQANTIRDLSGLDTADLDTKRCQVFAERTEVNRQAKAAQAQIAGQPDYSDAPDERISVEQTLREIRHAEHAQNARTVIESEIQTLAGDNQTAQEWIDKSNQEIVRIRSVINDRENAIARKRNLLDQSPAPDIDTLHQNAQNAARLNSLYEAKKQATDLIETSKTLNAQTAEMSKQIDGIDQEKSLRIAAAKMPIDGIAIDSEGLVTFSGVPLEQASLAEQIRISAAMGLALNPELRVLLIRDGSLLDIDSLRLLGEFAESNDVQIWLERVAGDGPVGIVIEDGEIVP